MKIVSVALSTGIALSTLSTPTMAHDLDDALRIIGKVFTVHHRNRVLVCDADDDDGGRRCYYVRRGYSAYNDNDDDDGHWRRYSDDDDDDGGRWGDDDD